MACPRRTFQAAAGLQRVQHTVRRGSGPERDIDSTPAIQAAVNATPVTGGTVFFPVGTFRLNSTVYYTGTGPIYFQGSGRWATSLYFYGSGDCIRVYDSTLYAARTQNGGGVTGLLIDGTNAAPGSSGLHMGDIQQFGVDLVVQNFSQPGSKGVWFDTQYYWTEQLFGRIFAQNCMQHVVFDKSPGAAPTAGGSFDRVDLGIYVNSWTAAQDGVVLQNGATLIDGALEIRGNFETSSVLTSAAVLRITGLVGPGFIDSGVYSNISCCRLYIGAECGIITGTKGAYTIWFGAAGNFIWGCTGTLDFSAAGLNFQLTNGTLAQFNFLGFLAGDSNLAQTYSGTVTSTSVKIYGTAANPTQLTGDSNGLLVLTSPAGMNSYVQQSAPVTVAPVTVTAAAITALGFMTIPANDPVAAAKYRFKMHGTLGTASSAPTATVDIRWGGTGGTLLTSFLTGTTATALTVSLSAVPVEIEGEVTFVTATTVVAWLKMTWRNSATASTAPIVALASITSPVTVVTSGTNYLAVDWTWSATGSGTTITIASASFERVA